MISCQSVTAVLRPLFVHPSNHPLIPLYILLIYFTELNEIFLVSRCASNMTGQQELQCILEIAVALTFTAEPSAMDRMSSSLQGSFNQSSNNWHSWEDNRGSPGGDRCGADSTKHSSFSIDYMYFPDWQLVSYDNLCPCRTYIIIKVKHTQVSGKVHLKVNKMGNPSNGLAAKWLTIFENEG